jgi:uncharacterized protein YcnI
MSATAPSGQRRRGPAPRALLATAGALLVGLVWPALAAAHARISPPVSLAGELQLYSLAVPTEQAGATTTKIVLAVPPGFSIDSFVPSPGWRRTVQQSVVANGAIAETVTWSGGAVPTGEDALFQFLGEASKDGSYDFQVDQTYSNGAIVDWAGPESSPTPGPSVQAESSLGGGGSSLLALAALAVAAVALVVAVVGLASGGGRRPLA